jgi:hypothetical protein
MFVGLYDRLTGNNAEIAYEFDDLEIDVPSSTSSDAPHALWKLNGTMRISTRNTEKRG